MSIPDIKEITLDELNPFEGDPSLFLTENPDGLWKKLEFDPTTTIQNPTNVLILHEDKIVLGPPGGGGGSSVELQGDISGAGVTGAPIATEIKALSTGINIPDKFQDFLLPGGFPGEAQQFRYIIKEATMPYFWQMVEHESTSRKVGFVWAFENGQPDKFQITTSDNANLPIASFSKDSSFIDGLVVNNLANPTTLP